MKKNLSALGITSIIIILICSIISLVLSSIDFNILYARWSSSYYKYLAPCSVASTCFCVFVSLIGLLILLFNINGLMTIFVVLLLLSTLASWGTAVISIMGGRIKHKHNGSLGCQTELTGVLQIFENIDIYLMYVNSLFCSANCKCKFSDDSIKENIFLNDETDVSKQVYESLYILNDINYEKKSSKELLENLYKLTNCNNMKSLFQNLYQKIYVNKDIKEETFNKFKKFINKNKEEFILISKMLNQPLCWVVFNLFEFEKYLNIIFNKDK